MIFIRETAARPTNVRHLELFECSDHVVAYATSVRNLRIWTNPDAFKTP
jgi:hypothetical protein